MRVLTGLGLCDEAMVDSGADMYLANSKTRILTEEQGIYSFKTWLGASVSTKGMMW